MSRLMNGVVLAAAFMCLTAIAPMAQTATSSETKTFEVLAVDGNQLVVRLPEGTREWIVPSDFRFTINGQQMSVQQLNAGMKGTATVTTRTTVTPVTVTDVKSGTVVVRSGSGIIVRTPEGVKSFTQGDVDKRGVKIVRDGKVVQLSQLREGDQLSATIITSLPPRVVTEQEVNATLAANKTAAGGGSTAPARSASGTMASAGTGAAPQAGATPQAQAGAGQASTSGGARTLPATASSWPLLWLVSVLSLAIGLALTIRRRLVS